jgi:hypothetical protein
MQDRSIEFERHRPRLFGNINAWNRLNIAFRTVAGNYRAPGQTPDTIRKSRTTPPSNAASAS